ncbi:MAG TPA: DUF6496 domain-containing protein [Acetobacteraceae bacterium]|nr:DUF6496 domain-containing protein [Acetobacteraceae bacterium]
MARHQSPAQQETIERVMHEFKHGDLKRGRGGKVRNPKQAIAIALSEAGASNRQSPKENRQRLRATKRKEAAGRTGAGKRPTRQELYRQAQRKGVAGRSKMSKAELARAVRR